MTTRRKRSPASVAIAAAIALFVQAFLGGAWMGAQAAAGPRDAFGNVLCTANADNNSQNGSHNGGYDCDCCLSGCDVGTGIIPEASSVEAASTAYLRTSAGKPPVDAPVWRRELQPLGPRAPPARG